jgi:hypothetical protein
MKNFSSNDEPEEWAHQDRVVTVKEIYKKEVVKEFFIQSSINSMSSS